MIIKLVFSDSFSFNNVPSHSQLLRNKLIAELFVLCYTPPSKWGGGGYMRITPSVCHPVGVSDCGRMISPYMLNHFLPDVAWWCIIMRQCVLQKNWFTIFNVRVVARAYIIKYDYFCYVL